MDVKMRIIGETTKVGFDSTGATNVLDEPGEGNRYLIYNVISNASDGGSFTLKAFKDGESDITVMQLPGGNNDLGAPILNCAKPFEWPVGYGVKSSESTGAVVIYQLLEG